MIKDFIALSCADLTFSTTLAQSDEFRSTGWKFFPASIGSSVWVPSTDWRMTEAVCTETTSSKIWKHVVYITSICHWEMAEDDFKKECWVFLL